MQRNRFTLAPASAALLAMSLLTAFVPYARVGHASTQHLRAARSLVAAPNTVTIHAVDYAFKAPDSLPSGMTTFNLVNDGTMLHHMQVVRLDSGKTMSDVANSLKHPGPLPVWMVLVGGPNAPDPGRTANATVNLTPGNYALICFVDVPDGVPHFAKGMAHTLKVFNSGVPVGPPPNADLTITLKDYSFAFSKPVTAGSHTFKVQNTASQPHEIEVIQLAAGKTSQDMLNWIQKPAGPPPGQAIGGVAGLAAGIPAYFTADFASANYLLLCFIPDAKDGKRHLMHGMVQTIKVS